MMARSTTRRFWTGWGVAALVGFAAGTATAWAVAHAAAAAQDAPIEFPQRRIAQSEWLRVAPSPLDLDGMIRRPRR